MTEPNLMKLPYLVFLTKIILTLPKHRTNIKTL